MNPKTQVRRAIPLRVLWGEIVQGFGGNQVSVKKPKCLGHNQNVRSLVCAGAVGTGGTVGNVVTRWVGDNSTAGAL